MLINNFCTLIYTFLNGKRVGIDKKGNKFYVHKRNNKKKWVLYKDIVEPTLLMVSWQLWLTNKSSEIPSMSNSNNNEYKWQKEREPNYSGTKNSYHPKVSKKKNY